jgi:hypothetical protein
MVVWASDDDNNDSNDDSDSDAVVGVGNCPRCAGASWAGAEG